VKTRRGPATVTVSAATFRCHWGNLGRRGRAMNRSQETCRFRHTPLRPTRD